MEIEEIGKKCCGCLREKIQLLEVYELATSRLSEAIASGDVKQLDLHRKERQGIIDKIGVIDREFNGLMETESFSIEKVSGETRSLARSYVGWIKAILESISGLEKGSLERTMEEYDSMKSAILKMQRGRGVTGRYRPARERVPRFLDTRS